MGVVATPEERKAKKVLKPRVIYSNHNYRVGIVVAPSGVPAYGVINLKTHMIEAYISQLALAIKICDEYDKDLRFGIDREEEDSPQLPMFTRPKSNSGDSGALH